MPARAPTTRVSLLGSLGVAVGGRPVRIPSAHRRILLLRLVLDLGHPVSADALADALWGEDLPKDPANALRFHVWKLREALGGGDDVIATVPGGYRLCPESVWVDAAAFEELATSARARGDANETAGLLDEALALWRGTPYEDAASAGFALPEVRRLEEMYLLTREDRIAALLALGRHDAAIADLEAMVAEHPLRERLWGMLMTALYRAGRQADALRSYQRARDVLGDELGIEPTPELRDLEERILFQDLAPPPPVASPRHNLPAILTTIVGREAEIDRIRSMLGERRLVTVTGVGGAGKTRLSIEVGRRSLDTVPDGVWLVDLTATQPGEDLSAVVAEGLGLQPTDTGTPADVLREFLMDRALLLVLDNCEHLLTPAAALVSRLLHEAAALRILATSRAPLQVPGEQVFPIPQLEPPPSDAADWESVMASPAGLLLVERAAEAGVDLVGMGADPAAAARLCRGLDGLPLAIELAAARTRLLSLNEIEARLDDRFSLLKADRAGEARHRTMLATVEWSYDLVSPPGRRLFERLAVFRGTFDLEGVEAAVAFGELAAGEVLDLLQSLIDQSLVARIDEGDGSRYRLLETFRAFALDRLERSGDLVEASERHAGYFAGMAEAAWIGRRGSQQQWWMVRLRREEANLRAALEHLAGRGGGNALVHVVGALGWFWVDEWRLDEVGLWLDLVVGSLDGAAPRDAGRVHLLAAFVAGNRGDRDLAEAHLDACLARSAEAGDDLVRADALRLMVVTPDTFARANDADLAAAALDEALGLYRRAGDRWGEGYLHLARAQGKLWASHLEEAREAAEEAAGVFAAIDDDVGVAWSLVEQAQAVSVRNPGRQRADLARRALTTFERLGMTSGERAAAIHIAEWARFHDDADTAIRYHRFSYDIALRQGYLWQIVASGGMLALALRAAGRFSEAAGHLIGTLERALRRGVDEQTAWVVECAAGLLGACGAAEVAACLYGAAEAVRRDLDRPMPTWDVADYQEDRARVAAVLGEPAFGDLVDRGGRWSLSAASDAARRALEGPASGG